MCVRHTLRGHFQTYAGGGGKGCDVYTLALSWNHKKCLIKMGSIVLTESGVYKI